MQKCAMLSSVRHFTSSCTCSRDGVRCLHHTHLDDVMCGRQPRVVVAAVGCLHTTALAVQIMRTYMADVCPCETLDELSYMVYCT